MGKSKILDQFPPARGCYVIRAEGEVLYVGKSRNMQRRWKTHNQRNFLESNFPNAEVEIIPWDGDLDDKEYELIRKLSPLLNKHLNMRPLGYFERLKEAIDRASRG